IRQARGTLTSEPSKQPKNKAAAEPLGQRAVGRGFARLGYTVIAIGLVLLGLMSGALAWEHREDIMARLARLSHSLQQLLRLEPSPTQVLGLPSVHNRETAQLSPAEGRSQNQGMNNQLTKNYRESVDYQVDDAVKSLTKVVLAPNSKQDAVLEKRSSSDVRAQTPDQKIITVQLGDTLTKIMIREYGKYDRSTLDSVLKANPDILDISHIEVGRRITLPRPPQTTTNN